jgi:hypothetical protein
MTEEEAKTKWCPMVNHVNGQMQQCGNHMTGVPVSQTFNACIGSACMMWRTDQRFTVHRDVVPINVRFSDNGEIRSELATPDEPQHGHCGMGGKP